MPPHKSTRHNPPIIPTQTPPPQQFDTAALNVATVATTMARYHKTRVLVEVEQSFIPHKVMSLCTHESALINTSPTVNPECSTGSVESLPFHNGLKGRNRSSRSVPVLKEEKSNLLHAPSVIY